MAPSYRVLLGVGVEDLRLLPVVQGVVDQGGEDHVVVEVGGVRVRVEVDGVQEDAEPVIMNIIIITIMIIIIIIITIITCPRRGR